MSDRVPLRVRFLNQDGTPESNGWTTVWGIVVTTRDPLTDEPEGFLHAQTDGHSLILRGDEDDPFEGVPGPFCRR